MYKLLEGKQTGENTVYTPRGGCADFVYSHDREVIAVGPSETGKTLAACWKIHILACKYPGMKGAIIRKTQKSVHGSVLQTFQHVIEGAPVEIYGGEKPEKYIYPNGSVIWIGGMDNADKVLSSERDIIYVNQVEELILDDWEKLTTRTTGRSAVIPFPQTIGDCNPSSTSHWIRIRTLEGKLWLIQTRHQDNPTLFDDAGNLTEQGKRTMETLQALTGVRRKRLLEGNWATAEGAVYDTFDASIHVTERDLGEMKTWNLTLDEGYTNPAVILLVGEDPDKRWHVFKEWYECGKLQSSVVQKAKEWNEQYHPSVIAVDAAAAGLIGELQNNGIRAQGLKGRVLDGIQNIQDRLRIQPDQRPRLTIDPSCINTINEFESYSWKQSSAGFSKDEPQKENDHAMDALRYLTMAASNGFWCRTIR